MQKRCSMKNIYTECEKSTVALLKNGVCVGTAWILYPGYECVLVTANHVINKDSDSFCVQFCKQIDQRQSEFSIEVLFRDESNDVAIFTLKDQKARDLCIGTGLDLSEGSQLTEGDGVFCVSHPHGVRFVLNKGRLSSVLNGDRGFTRQKGKYDRMFVEMQASHGSSGAPVCDEFFGNIVGMVLGGDEEYMPNQVSCITSYALNDIIGKFLFENKIAANRDKKKTNYFDLIEEIHQSTIEKFHIEDQKLYVYNGTESLVRIPSNVKVIGGGAFLGNEYVRQVIIPEGVRKIELMAFASSSLEEIVLPRTIEIIENSAFAGCENLIAIRTSELPLLRKLGDNAFFDCEKLVEFPKCDSLQEIGSGCFYGCESILSMTLPSSINKIGEMVFSSYTRVTVKDNPYYEKKGSCLIDKREKKIISSFAIANIPEDGSATSIGKGAFNKIFEYEISIPSVIKDIHPLAALECGDVKLVKKS